MVYSIQYILYSIQYIVFGLQHTVYDSQYIVYSIQYIYCTQYIKYGMYYVIYSIDMVHVYTIVHIIVYIVCGISYILNNTQCIIHIKWHIKYYIVHIILYNVYMCMNRAITSQRLSLAQQLACQLIWYSCSVTKNSCHHDTTASATSSLAPLASSLNLCVPEKHSVLPNLHLWARFYEPPVVISNDIKADIVFAWFDGIVQRQKK